jgi:uncharacterized protein
MKNDLLMIFIKNPIAGKVKTRLAKTIGEQQALEIYKDMLSHTLKISSTVDGTDKIVYYSDFIDDRDEWAESGFFQALQQGADLGDKMGIAFNENFIKGYKKIIIIGSDCLELNSALIVKAFKSLDEHDAVIGPVVDGGYYLLGMNQANERLFRNKQWSTETVCQSTIADLEAGNLRYALLETLNDIDEEADLIHFHKRNSNVITAK